jgi:hypothetical protein
MRETLNETEAVIASITWQSMHFAGVFNGQTSCREQQARHDQGR